MIGLDQETILQKLDEVILKYTPKSSSVVTLGSRTDYDEERESFLTEGNWQTSQCKGNNT